MARPLLALAASIAALASAQARADSTSPWHLQAEAITDVPIDVGGRVLLEGPLRLRLSTSLGALPGPYAGLINDFVVAIGGYNQATASLIQSSLSSALVWRTHLGWRPFPRAGFVFDVGYGLVALGGSVNTAAAVAAAAGKSAVDKPGAPTYAVASTLQMIDADVGWEWTFFSDHLVVEASLGFSGTLGASSTATPQGPSNRLTDAFGNEAAKYLDEEYTGYVFAPVATVAVGYRFF